MSSVAITIHCPRCRRPYVLRVDLEAFCSAPQPGRCARCGARFDMAEQVVKARVRAAASEYPEPAAARPAGSLPESGEGYGQPEPAAEPDRLDLPD